MGEGTMKDWHELIDDVVAPSILKIETPAGFGTGFLFARNESRSVTAIATAHHVIEQADKWQQPIRIHNATLKETILLQEPDRVIIPSVTQDSAVIIIPSAKIASLNLPEKPIEFITEGKRLKVGVEVGWLGFPGIDSDTLCFFLGNISAWRASSSSYLIDGVVIHGVSGSPVFRKSMDSIDIIGAITAYMPNRLTGGTLPGLSIAQDVSHFQDFVTRMKNWDEAARKKKEQEALIATNPSGGTAPPVESK
jgi:hypothetical protein